MKILPVPGQSWRSTPIAIFAVALVIVLGGIGIIVQSEWTYNAARDDVATMQATVLGSSVSAAVDFNDAATAQQTVDAFSANPVVRLVAIYGRDGRGIAGYRRNGTLAPTYQALEPAGEQG